MSDTIQALAQRIEDLESQLSFQDELHQNLDDTVARQDREIIELKLQLTELARRLVDLRDAGGISTGDPAGEVPPHY